MKDEDVRDTPPELFAELIDLYGRSFSCDVCASLHNTKVPDCYYTLEGLACGGHILKPGQHGLNSPWPAHWFCNPPYSELGLWVERAWEVRRPGLMFLPNTREEQPWWQKLVEPYRDGRGRRGNVPCDLTTHYLPKRRRFFANGQPIMSKKDPSKLGSPRFGVVALIWR